MTEDGSDGYSLSILPDFRGTPFSISINPDSAIGPDGTTLTGGVTQRFSQTPQSRPRKILFSIMNLRVTIPPKFQIFQTVLRTVIFWVGTGSR